MANIPYVIEYDEKNRERSYDLYSRLLKDRIIFLRGEFGQEMADSVVGQLLFLETSDRDKDIYMYIDSRGGLIDSMYAIYDTMQYIIPDVVTAGIGTVSSAGSFILAAGKKGKRYALPNTEIMIHELSTGAAGKFNDVDNRYKHVKKLYEKMAAHYSEFTGQSIKKVKKDMQRDFYMSAEEAKEYGLIDEVQYKRSE